MDEPTSQPPPGSNAEVDGGIEEEQVPEDRPRLRVMLVRLPQDDTGNIQRVLPGGRPVDPNELPMITRITADRAAAERTARRLRDAGAVVLITEEPADPDHSAFCVDHPHRLAPGTCTRCGIAVCGRCKRDADGEEMCSGCLRQGHSRSRNTRLRQLFVVFLFAVFVYEVVSFINEDQARVAPDGTVRAVVVQFISPAAVNSPIIRALNSTDGAQDGTSFHALGPWFSQERSRYASQEGWLQVDVRGPWPLEVNPPQLENPSLSRARLLFNSWQWPRYFHDIAGDFGVDTDQYGIRAYVIYGGGGDVAAHSRGSKTGRIAVSWVGEDEQNPGYAVLTVAHEMGHALGAFDRYDGGTYQARYPEGYIEPYANPLYPQRFAELMAVDVPLSLGTEREVRSLNEVRIGHRTAEEIGWIHREQADLFYSPPAKGPLDRLPARPDETQKPTRPDGPVPTTPKDTVVDADEPVE